MSRGKKEYALQASPLYRIGTKKDLAEILAVTPSELRALQKLGDDGYIKRMSKPKPGKKAREVQDPKPKLKAIHKRLNRLMQRVIHPAYVQAGLRNLSYHGNAESHPPNTWVCKVDVKSFYPNCRREKVYQFFHGRLQCSPDVSKILSDLNTIAGHLPTGGPFSMLLSFWSYFEMFEEIRERAEAKGLKMTLYVDDLTFSGPGARPKFLNDVVNPILERHGLKGHKIKAYSPSQPKVITGVVRTEAGSKIPFDRARKIKANYEELGKACDPSIKLRLMNQLISRLCEAASIEPRYQVQVKKMLACRRNFLQENSELKLSGKKVGARRFKE